MRTAKKKVNILFTILKKMFFVLMVVFCASVAICTALQSVEIAAILGTIIGIVGRWVVAGLIFVGICRYWIRKGRRK